MTFRNYIIGVDFDNTIVSYDDIFYNEALQQDLINTNVKKYKKDIRDRIRQLPEGENEWQRLQDIGYGPKMEEAKLIDGVFTFFELCQLYKIKVNIVSHKTKYTELDGTKINLRAVALEWMRNKKFFNSEGLGLSQENIYFESTRHEKIERIISLMCTHFIDDLEETFLESFFPQNIEKIIYSPFKQNLNLQGVRVVTSWKEIIDYFFGQET